MNLEHLDNLQEVWQPDPNTFSSAPLGRMAAKYGLSTAESVHERAAQDPNWYWEAAAKDVGLRWLRQYDDIIDLSRGPEFAHFFPGGQLNWSDYAVDRWVDAGRGDARAITWEGDDGEKRNVTYFELKEQIDKAAGALLAAGVQRSDAIGLVVPMIPEAVVAVLAAARIGAIIVPMFSGYGSAAIRERMVQSDAQYLITVDMFHRRGRPVRVKDTVDEAIIGLPIRRVLVIARSGVANSVTLPHDRWWHDELSAATPVRKALAMESDDPCLLLFTSGSTGRPKGTLHTHAGMPFKLATEARHGMGLDENGTLMWVTDMGWVMGSFVIAAALGNGGTAALFEGTPDWPHPDRLWSFVEEAEVTVLGVSPTAVRSLMQHGDSWVQKHDLSKLQAIGSTGEPWNVEPWLWCYENVGNSRTPIVNISGGTECGGSLLSGSIHLGAKPMSFSGPTLGIAADIVDDSGQSVREGVGELIVRYPWPGMTKGLWKDPRGEKYLSEYWERFPGVWHQSDFGYIDSSNYWYLLGRSDDTMSIAGKRIGPAEVESALVRDTDVIEAAAVSIPDEIKGEAIIAFVVLRDGSQLTEITPRLLALVREDLGPAISPKTVIQLAELPKTRSGKVLRRVIRASYLGLPLGDLSSLDNPNSLEGLSASHRLSS